MLQWFNPPEGEGYVSAERRELAFAELASYRAWCIEHCNAYEAFTLHLNVGKVYLEQKQFNETFSAWQEALNTGVRVPIGYERDMLMHSANIYFDKGEYELLFPCVKRLNELGLVTLIHEGHLVAAANVAQGKYAEALDVINTVIKFHEEENNGLSKSRSYVIKNKILALMNRSADSDTNAKLSLALAREAQPSLYQLAPARLPNLVVKGQVAGKCSVELDVLENGKTTNVRVVACDHTLLEEPAVKAIQASSFRPKLENGTPVKTTGVRQVLEFSRSGISPI
jgi:tetratricopeptide (TPR) repeat protein